MNIVKNVSPLTLSLLSVLSGLSMYSMEHNNDMNIFKAAESGDLTRIQELIALDVDVNLKDDTYYRRTPLHWAALSGRTDIVKELIAHGASVNQRDEFNDTPLHLAVRTDYIEPAQILIAHGADIDLQNKNGWTPLFVSIDSGHFDIARLLINAGANVNQQDRDDWTPLHLAALGGHWIHWDDFLYHHRYFEANHCYINMVKMLIDFGANIEVQNKKNYTPLSLAQHIDSLSNTTKNEVPKTPIYKVIIELLTTAKNRQPVLLAAFDQSESNQSPFALLPGDMCLLKEIIALSIKHTAEQGGAEILKPLQGNWVTY